MLAEELRQTYKVTFVKSLIDMSLKRPLPTQE